MAIEPGSYSYPRVSPDGKSVALDINTGQRDIWILNLQRLTLTQLTHGPTEDGLPEWGTDGRVYFASDRSGNFDIYSQLADGASGDRLEYAAPGFQAPEGATPDGTRLLVYERFNDLSLLTLGQRDRIVPLLQSKADEALPDLSPDGRWMAYESLESGTQFEVFVRPFPDVNGSREKVSVNGGRYPRWAPKGNEIHYVNLDGGMMAASISFFSEPENRIDHEAVRLAQTADRTDWNAVRRVADRRTVPDDGGGGVRSAWPDASVRGVELGR